MLVAGPVEGERLLMGTFYLNSATGRLKRYGHILHLFFHSEDIDRNSDFFLNTKYARQSGE